MFVYKSCVRMYLFLRTIIMMIKIRIRATPPPTEAPMIIARLSASGVAATTLGLAVMFNVVFNICNTNHTLPSKKGKRGHALRRRQGAHLPHISL